MRSHRTRAEKQVFTENPMASSVYDEGILQMTGQKGKKGRYVCFFKSILVSLLQSAESIWH